MIRPLFISELKRTLPSNLLIGGCVLVAAAVIEHLVPRAGLDSQRADEVADVCALGFGFLSAFLFGAKAFGQLKDNHSAFLLTLPVSRIRSWATIVAANLAGALAISGAIVILHFPSGAKITMAAIAGLLAVYLGLFILGCWTVLVFKRATSVAVGGFGLALAGGIFIVFFSAYLGDSDGFLSSSVALFLLILLFAASASAFARAEFRDLRVWCRNLGMITVGWIAFSAVLAAIIVAGVPARWGAWDERVSWAAVSDDGRKLAVLTTHLRYEVYSRVHFVDIEKGVHTGTFLGRGLHQPIWSADGSVLNVIATPLTNFNSLLRLSPDGRKVEETTAPLLTSFYMASRKGNELWISAGGANSNFYLTTDDSAGAFEQIGDGNLEQDLNLLQRLSIAIGTRSLTGSLLQELRKNFPPPEVGGDEVGAYWVGAPGHLSSTQPPLYVRSNSKLNQGEVLVHRGSSGWKAILQETPLRPVSLLSVANARGVIQQLRWQHVEADPERRVIAYRKQSTNGTSFFVYDRESDRVFDLGALDDPGSVSGDVSVGLLPDGETRYISFSGSIGFLYFPESKTFKQISLPPAPRFWIWADKAGNQILHDGPTNIVYVRHDGSRRRLWPNTEAATVPGAAP